MNLLDIAKDWSPWGSPAPRSVPREVPLPKALTPGVALVVQGVRRCGKSTLLQQLVGHYGLDPARCAFLNFEDPRLSGALNWQTLDRLVADFRAHHGKARPTKRAPLAFFLDEIQWVDGWQRWLRARLDRPDGCLFVVTGSNAQLLSGELGSTLTGRHLTVELAPFSLDEARRAKPRLSLQRWLERGGFPAPLTSVDGPALLRQYFSDIIERDVRERVGARSTVPLRALAQLIFESAGAELSMRRASAALGLATETAQQYVGAFEAAYLVSGCPFFAFSERQRAALNRKFYPVDTGLRRAVITQTGDDRGKHLECATFHALRRRFGAVSYWRGKGEVDFVVQREDGKPVPVQVSWKGPQERHHRALQAFYEQFPFAAEAVFVDAQNYERFARGELDPA